MPLVSWSTQQLVELLATVTAYPDEGSAIRVAVERAAEALEAEVAALVKSDAPAVAIGFPQDAVPRARLAGVADGRAHSIEIPGGGASPAVGLALDDPPGGHLVLARSGEEFHPDELALLRGMGQVLTPSLRMLHAVEAERTLRQENRRQAEVEVARLEHVALTDSLTGLRNLRAFDEDLGRELRRFGRGRGPLTLVMLDLDGLKQVNDALGHQAGDDHLKALAALLLETARGGDAAYRVGGDEFALVLAGESAWGGLRLAQRLQDRLGERANGSRPSVTAGVAELIDPTTKDALVRQADLALIEAKRSCRQALIYSEGIEPASIEPDDEAERHRLTTLATALARTVDAKDSYTRSHSETVAETCALIARELDLEPDRIEKLRLAGLLHDVGKIGIPDAILQKPGPLTDREFEVMKTHTTLGHSIVRGAEFEEEAEWIRHHHERMDGGGYPDGLPAEELALESRIILVADAFEALTSDRPYRRGRPEADAMLELERHAASQFDPDCVAALRQALSPERGLLTSTR